jgi:hypothetical protein
LLLPFVPKEGEREVVEAFEQVMPVRRLTPTAREVSDRRFFETVVRVHREEEVESRAAISGDERADR